jgi:hypothetical protein
MRRYVVLNRRGKKIVAGIGELIFATFCVAFLGLLFYLTTRYVAQIRSSEHVPPQASWGIVK